MGSCPLWRSVQHKTTCAESEQSSPQESGQILLFFRGDGEQPESLPLSLFMSFPQILSFMGQACANSHTAEIICVHMFAFPSFRVFEHTVMA